MSVCLVRTINLAYVAVLLPSKVANELIKVPSL